MQGSVKKGGWGILMSGIIVIGGLLGWIAYADEILLPVTLPQLSPSSSSEILADINNVTNGIAPPVDTANISLIADLRETVEAVHNTSISQDLFNNPISSATVLTNHFSNYCSTADGVGVACTQDPLLQYGDMKISSLLSETAYSTNGTTAAQNFLSNLMNPPGVTGVTNFYQTVIDAATVTGSAPSASLQTQAAFVQALSDEAMMSIIREPFAQMMAMRTPYPIAAAPSGSSTQSPPPPVSPMQMMEATAIQRYMSSAWMASMNLSTTTPQQIAAQQASMQAFQVWLSYQQYRQMERIEALLSVLALQNFRQQKASQAQYNQAQAQNVAAGAN